MADKINWSSDFKTAAWCALPVSCCEPALQAAKAKDLRGVRAPQNAGPNRRVPPGLPVNLASLGDKARAKLLKSRSIIPRSENLPDPDHSIVYKAKSKPDRKGAN